jgi:hypothetical protein
MWYLELKESKNFIKRGMELEVSVVEMSLQYRVLEVGLCFCSSCEVKFHKIVFLNSFLWGKSVKE